MLVERLRLRPTLHRRLQTAVLGTLDDGTMSWDRVWEDQMQALTPRAVASSTHLGP